MFATEVLDIGLLCSLGRLYSVVGEFSNAPLLGERDDFASCFGLAATGSEMSKRFS